MSDLRPCRELFKLGGERFWLLFSIKAIDEIQSELNLPIFDAVDKLMLAANMDISEPVIRSYAGILMAVINTNGKKKKSFSEAVEMLTVENYVQTAIHLLDLFWKTMPEKEDYDPDEDDEEESEKKPERAINVAQLLYIGCVVM